MKLQLLNQKIKKKKIISSKELSDNYWTDFENKQKLFSTKKNNVADIRKN